MYLNSKQIFIYVSIYLCIYLSIFLPSITKLSPANVLTWIMFDSFVWKMQSRRSFVRFSAICYLSFFLSIHLSIYLFIYLYIYLSYLTLIYTYFLLIHLSKIPTYLEFLAIFFMDLKLLAFHLSEIAFLLSMYP